MILIKYYKNKIRKIVATSLNILQLYRSGFIYIYIYNKKNNNN
ncbi:hypothetical protein PFFVO_03196 [Plasmodium falciparum Vietnam Oak-Knoll (FVO)]|uniref:Uncharacterized protein n=1 Tax=Plasmodium falciparum Vietnam Oak-Knoll (FVO) TaxID=1036723 RepID=A0A024V659_PLAFA|nr:hypothetical protein PFFVO_03196 [Plasmodium falciparum Vietnam Oak-Knoll (FVO)]